MTRRIRWGRASVHRAAKPYECDSCTSTIEHGTPYQRQAVFVEPGPTDPETDAGPGRACWTVRRCARCAGL